MEIKITDFEFIVPEWIVWMAIIAMVLSIINSALKIYQQLKQE